MSSFLPGILRLSRTFLEVSLWAFIAFIVDVNVEMSRSAEEKGKFRTAIISIPTGLDGRISTHLERSE